MVTCTACGDTIMQTRDGWSSQDTDSTACVVGGRHNPTLNGLMALAQNEEK